MLGGPDGREGGRACVLQGEVLWLVHPQCLSSTLDSNSAVTLSSSGCFLLPGLGDKTRRNLQIRVVLGSQ